MSHPGGCEVQGLCREGCNGVRRLECFRRKKNPSLQHRDFPVTRSSGRKGKLELVARKRLPSERDQKLSHIVSGETAVSSSWRIFKSQKLLELTVEKVAALTQSGELNKSLLFILLGRNKLNFCIPSWWHKASRPRKTLSENKFDWHFEICSVWKLMISHFKRRCFRKECYSLKSSLDKYIDLLHFWIMFPRLTAWTCVVALTAGNFIYCCSTVALDIRSQQNQILY